jgi:hypothetical protein
MNNWKANASRIRPRGQCVTRIADNDDKKPAKSTKRTDQPKRRRRKSIGITLAPIGKLN